MGERGWRSRDAKGEGDAIFKEMDGGESEEDGRVRQERSGMQAAEGVIAVKDREETKQKKARLFSLPAEIISRFPRP